MADIVFMRSCRENALRRCSRARETRVFAFSCVCTVFRAVFLVSRRAVVFTAYLRLLVNFWRSVCIFTTLFRLRVFMRIYGESAFSSNFGVAIYGEIVDLGKKNLFFAIIHAKYLIFGEFRY